MRRTIAVVLCLLATAAEPSAAGEGLRTRHRSQHTRLQQQYLHLYWEVVRTHGRRTPGRNIVTRGYQTATRVRVARRAELGRSIRTFKRWLAPPPAPVAAVDRVPQGQAPAQAGGRWAIPGSIVMCESGGDYGAVNPGSGARGAYQLLPSTYYGHGGDGSWSPQDQDRVAARVWNGGAGRSQWVC